MGDTDWGVHQHTCICRASHGSGISPHEYMATGLTFIKTHTGDRIYFIIEIRNIEMRDTDWGGCTDIHVYAGLLTGQTYPHMSTWLQGGLS